MAPLAQPWRTRAIVAAAIAALELVVVLVLALALVGPGLSAKVEKRAAEAARAPAAKKVKKKARKPILARPDTSVVVLNGNGRTGAAAGMAEVVRARGYLIGNVGNASRTDYRRNVVMYRKGYEREGRRLARDLSIRVVGPLDGLKPRDLMGAQVALVVGD
jgi:hypothetical protein